MIPVLVLGMFLKSDSSGNKHFRFFTFSGTSCLVFLRLLDSFLVFVLLFTLCEVDRDQRILFPSDTFAEIKLK